MEDAVRSFETQVRTFTVQMAEDDQGTPQCQLGRTRRFRETLPRVRAPATEVEEIDPEIVPVKMMPSPQQPSKEEI